MPTEAGKEFVEVEPREGNIAASAHVTKLPTDLSGRDVRAALERVGFVFRRQAGSHMMLRRDQPYARVVASRDKTIRLWNPDSGAEAARL